MKKKTNDNFYDSHRMAEIIICLIENFGEDKLIKYLLDRLIRKETDPLPPSFKSTKVVELEKKHIISLVGVPRNKLYRLNRDLSKVIVIEHGLPEGQAIKMFFEKPNRRNIENILEDVKKNLVYITKEEHNRLKKDWRLKGKNGYYWENSYRNENIEVTNNT